MSEDSDNSYNESSLNYENICKYCLEDIDDLEERDKFRPCACKMPIHKKCLNNYLEVAKKEICDVCNVKYQRVPAEVNYTCNFWGCCKSTLCFFPMCLRDCSIVLWKRCWKLVVSIIIFLLVLIVADHKSVAENVYSRDEANCISKKRMYNFFNLLEIPG
tara:strand:- start:99 stop:578 length:480 start_codon:yes stop_codon:yes gene_type:complete